MSFTPKTWINDPSSPVSPLPGTTPISAAAMIDVETRLSTYTDTVIAALARYSTIQANGSNVTQRSILNIVGATVVDNPGSNRTDLTITAIAPSGVYTSVKSAPYNAVGNGIADDTAAIQAAIDAVSAAGGGVVFLPHGTYKLTATIFVKNGVSIYGETMGASILSFPTDIGTTVRALNKNVPAIDAYTNTNIQIAASHFRDFTLLGPNTTTTPGVRVVSMDGFHSGNNQSFINVAVHGFGGGMVQIKDHTMHIGCFYQENYYSVLHPSPRISQGNNDYYHCKFGGSGFAAIAVGGDTLLDFHRYFGCDVIASPYGFYKGDTTDNAGVVTPSVLGFLHGCLLDGCNFESIGNAFFLDESTGVGSGSDSVTDTTIWYPGCVWDDSVKIAARSQSYAFDVRGTQTVTIYADNNGFPPHPTAGLASYRTVLGFSADIHLHPAVTAAVFGPGTEGARYHIGDQHGVVYTYTGTVVANDVLMWDTANANTVTRNVGTTPAANAVFAGVAGLAPVAGTNRVAVANQGTATVATDGGGSAGRYVVPDTTNHHATTNTPTGKKVLGVCLVGGSPLQVKLLADAGWASP